ncbi:MAG: nitroreductase/quinone reductase family protein [Dermatophilaceae bacterium]
MKIAGGVPDVVVSGGAALSSPTDLPHFAAEGCGTSPGAGRNFGYRTREALHVDVVVFLEERLQLIVPRLPARGEPTIRTWWARDRVSKVQRALFVRVNRVLNALVRRLGLRRFRGADLLYLTTTGRKSGKVRTTPLLYLRDRDRWLVVASNGGADWEPGWWLNLRNGSTGNVDADGERTPVVGIEITSDERDVLWRRLNQQVFDFESYQRKVSRRLAVVSLVPIEAPPSSTVSIAPLPVE